MQETCVSLHFGISKKIVKINHFSILDTLYIRLLLTKMDDQRENPTSWQRKRTDPQCQPTATTLESPQIQSTIFIKDNCLNLTLFIYVVCTLGIIYHKSQFLGSLFCYIEVLNYKKYVLTYLHILEKMSMIGCQILDLL